MVGVDHPPQPCCCCCCGDDTGLRDTIVLARLVRVQVSVSGVLRIVDIHWLLFIRVPEYDRYADLRFVANVRN